MKQCEKPALQSCALEKIVLKCKMLDLGLPPYKIIGLALNPPEKHKIDDAILLLKETRGLHLIKNELFSYDDGDITFLGRLMDLLPIDVRATKLIVLGYLFGVCEECLIIAAGITVQKIFTTDHFNPLKTYNHRLAFADGSGSDLIGILHAYLVRIKCVIIKTMSEFNVIFCF